MAERVINGKRQVHDNIRDGISFPKTQKATDLMTEAPGEVDGKQLRELGIKIYADPK